MTRFLFPVHLQYFNDEFAGEPAEPVSEPTSVESEGVAAPQDQEPVTAEGQEPQIEQSKAFAKRLEERTQAKLAEERQRWEQEQAERYGDYDHYRQATEYFLEKGGYGDIHSLNQAIQEQMLREQAEQHNVPVEVMSRLQQLEHKAAQADYLQQEKQNREILSQFDNALNDYVKDKEGVSASDLEQFMIQNQIANFDIAYRALRAEQLEQRLATAKQDAVKEYLESKKAPRVEGSGAAGVISDAPPKSFDEARQRALERLRAANQQ